MEYRYEAIVDMPDYCYFMRVPNEYCTVHFHRSLEVLCVISGNHYVCINGNSRLLEAGDIAVVKPFETHYYCHRDNSEIYVFVVEDTYLRDFFELYRNRHFESFLCDKEYNQRVLALFDRWHESKEEGGVLLNKGYVNLILDALSKHYPLVNFRSDRSSHLIIEVLKYLAENYAEDITLDDIAARFSYSKYHFSMIFNRYVGVNLKSYLNSLRLSKVRECLQQDSNANLLDVVLKCGFNSLRTYYRACEADAKNRR